MRMKTKNPCPICDSKKVKSFLNRNEVPVHQNFLFKAKSSAINITKGKLSLVVCRECGFIFNQTFDFSKLKYGNLYDNTQDLSPLFEQHLKDIVQKLINNKNIKNCKIVEVGCGQGSFLRRLVENEEWNNVGYGFDPSYKGNELELDGRLNFVKKYYGPECADIKADIVVCRHVIEHVPKPVELLKTVREALMQSKNPRVFFETPTVDWILKNQVIWDFFYEHCYYFNPNSIRTAFELAGFSVEAIDLVFGNQYMLVEASIAKNKVQVIKEPNDIYALTIEYGNSESQNLEKWKQKLKKLSKKGKTAIWGAGAKGVTFCNLFDPTLKMVDCVIDLNPNKQGKYIPGTGHQIVDYNEIQSRNITSIILMNPNYNDEVKELLQKSNQSIDLIK